MKIQDLMEQSKNDKKGTYSAVKFSKNTTDRIKNFMEEHDIKNAINPDKFHCTVTYSRKYIPDYPAIGDINPPWIGKPTSFDIFTSQEGNNCLVLKFTCKEVTDKHNKIMDEYNATYDFDDYNPHITISYDCGDIDAKDYNKFIKQIGDIEIVNEYSEDLDLDWAKNNTK